MSRLRNAGIYLAIAAILILAGLAAWQAWGPVKPSGTASVIATEAPAVRYAPKASVTIKAPVKVYRGESKANLKLPAPVIADEHKEVLAASQVKSDLHPQTISTVVDTETGAVTTYTKIDPYPWLGIENRGSIGLAYGYKYSRVIGAHAPGPVGRLTVDYDLIRIKAFTVGGTATADSDSTAFAGVQLKYQW